MSSRISLGSIAIAYAAISVEEFDGSVLLVSHDRAFLREVATRVSSLDGTHLTDFDGPFVEWEAEARRTRNAARTQQNLRTRTQRPRGRLDRLLNGVHRPAMNLIKPLAAALLIALPDATFAQADTAFNVQLEVKSQGVAMRAPLFVAAGPGPHPTLITFKGFPGGNSSALSRFMQERGINSVILNFRGQYESDGTYDVAGSALDAAAFIAFLKSDSAVRAFRIDPRRIAISGQSAGSYAALSATANDATIRCSSLVVPFNWAVPLLEMRRSPLVRSAMVAQLKTIAARNADAVRLDSTFASRSVDIAEQLDLRTAALRLQGRQMLLVGAKQDATAPLALHFNPVLDSLRAGQALVRDTTFDDNHNLTGSTDEFFTLQADWVRSCTR